MSDLVQATPNESRASPEHLAAVSWQTQGVAEVPNGFLAQRNGEC
jgi:hypothetical protein